MLINHPILDTRHSPSPKPQKARRRADASKDSAKRRKTDHARDISRKDDVFKLAYNELQVCLWVLFCALSTSAPAHSLLRFRSRCPVVKKSANRCSDSLGVARNVLRRTCLDLVSDRFSCGYAVFI